MAFRIGSFVGGAAQGAQTAMQLAEQYRGMKDREAARQEKAAFKELMQHRAQDLAAMDAGQLPTNALRFYNANIPGMDDGNTVQMSSGNWGIATPEGKVTPIDMGQVRTMVDDAYSASMLASMNDPTKVIEAIHRTKQAALAQENWRKTFEANQTHNEWTRNRADRVDAATSEHRAWERDRTDRVDAATADWRRLNFGLQQRRLSVAEAAAARQGRALDRQEAAADEVLGLTRQLRAAQGAADFAAAEGDVENARVFGLRAQAISNQLGALEGKIPRAKTVSADKMAELIAEYRLTNPDASPADIQAYKASLSGMAPQPTAMDRFLERKLAAGAGAPAAVAPQGLHAIDTSGSVFRDDDGNIQLLAPLKRLGRTAAQMGRDVEAAGGYDY